MCCHPDADDTRGESSPDEDESGNEMSEQLQLDMLEDDCDIFGAANSWIWGDSPPAAPTMSGELCLEMVTVGLGRACLCKPD